MTITIAKVEAQALAPEAGMTSNGARAGKLRLNCADRRLEPAQGADENDPAQ